MPKMDVDLTNFTAGELSPRMKGRVDIGKYFNGCESLLNMVVMPQGGATRRPGTRFVGACKDQDHPCRLLPFIFSTLQAYAVEVSGAGAARFYTNDGQLQTGGVAVEAAHPWSADQLAALGYCQSADEMFLTHPKVPPQALKRLGAVSWSIGAVAFQDGPYLGNDPANRATPSGTSGTITVTWSNTNGLNARPGVAGGLTAADIGRMLRVGDPGGTSTVWGFISAVPAPNQATMTTGPAVASGAEAALGSAGATSAWALGKWSDARGYPYQPTFFQNRLFLCGTDSEPNAVEGSVIGDFFNFAPNIGTGTVTASNAVSWILSDDQVNAIRWLSPAGSAQTMQLGIGTVGSEKIMQPASSAQALGANNVQAYQETSLGSAANVRPQRIGKSVLFANRAGEKLHEWTFAWTVNGYLGPDLAVLAEHITRGGITQMAHQQMPYGVLWCTRADGALIGLTYLREQDVIAWHQHQLGGQYYGGPPIVESLCVIPSPDGSYDELWLAVLRTINGIPFRSIEVMERYFTGAPAEQAYFLDCGLSTVPTAPNGTATVTGLTNSAKPGRPPKLTGIGALHVTAGTPAIGKVVRMNGGRALITAASGSDATIKVVYPFNSMVPAAAGEWSMTTPFSTIINTAFFAGETIGILADGEVQPNVTAGVSVPIEGTATLAHAGLPYLSELIPMPLAPTAKAGGSATAGRAQRSETMYIRLHETVGGEYGTRITDEAPEPPVDQWDPIPMRLFETPMGQPVEPVSGVFRFKPPGGGGREVQFICRQDQPLPMTVLAIGGRINVEEVTPQQ